MDQQTADPGWSISQLWKVHSADPHSNTTDSPMKDAEGQKPVLDSPAHMWHEWCSRKGQTPRTENRSAVTSGWETLGLVELLCILTDVLVTGLNAFVRTWRVVQKWMSFKLCKLYLNEIFFSPGGGNGNSLQYSCLGNPMDRGPWWATVHGVAKRWTQLSDWACKHSYKNKLKID